jgi:tripartite-type tricarboxylate transporter receptor subunit TctC
MQQARRRFLHLVAGGALVPAMPRSSRAQSYPTRPVRLIVGLPPGNGADTQARLIGQWLSERLGQQCVVENRPGAGSNLATEAVVRAPPDGYTLLLTLASNTVNASLYDKLNFDFIRDIAPIACISRAPFILTVNPSVPARTVAEFIAYAKGNPGKLNFASNGNGSMAHVAGALFNMMAGINMVHVPYRTGAINDLLSGQVQVMFDSVPGLIAHIRTGKLRPLGVTTATRLEVLPDVPTVADFVPSYEASGMVGVGAPKRTPVEVIDMLNKEINTALADQTMKVRLADLGVTALALSSAEFGKLVVHETEKWGKVIRLMDIKPE